MNLENQEREILLRLIRDLETRLAETTAKLARYEDCFTDINERYFASAENGLRWIERRIKQAQGKEKEDES